VQKFQIYSLSVAASSFKMRFNFLPVYDNDKNNGIIQTSRFSQLLWLQYELLLPSLAWVFANVMP